ncbi:hypothetical protein V6V47_23805 [Micromonospora sp. CPCC 205539]|uniref:hypothetical protein n=1 Tax=Micromonospora sp. CPCC 205539 TaxID=3122408 RepID=UPI002FF3202E
METGIDPGEVRFRRSGWRVLARIGGAWLLWLAVFAPLNAAFGNPWYEMFPHGPIILLAVLGSAGQLRRQGGLPLRLTPDFLELTLSGGLAVRIDWPDLALAEVRGRFSPILVVEPVDADRTRPVLDRWEWGRLGLWDQGRIRRPHEIHVSLVGVTPDVHRLRAELTRRLGRPVGDARPESDA